MEGSIVARPTWMLRETIVLDLAQTTEFIDAIVFPLLGLLTLFFAKFRQGEAARRAQRQFLGVLVVMTLVTVRTVMECHDFWLIHTTSLGTLVIAAMMIPGTPTPEMAG